MVFCTYCGQSFTRDEHLERHILTHTNVKPFKCFTCHMSFARRDLLQRHYTVHGRNQDNEEGLPPQGIIPKSAGRTPIACSNCAKTKTKCDKKFPCTRCAQRNLTCTLRPTRRASKGVQRAAGLPEVGPESCGSSDASNAEGQNPSGSNSPSREVQPQLSNTQSSPQNSQPSQQISVSQAQSRRPSQSPSVTHSRNASLSLPVQPVSHATEDTSLQVSLAHNDPPFFDHGMLLMAQGHPMASPVPPPVQGMHVFGTSTPMSGYDEFVHTAHDHADNNASPQFMMDPWNSMGMNPGFEISMDPSLMMMEMNLNMGPATDGLLGMIPDMSPAQAYGPVQTPLQTSHVDDSFSDLQMGSSASMFDPSNRHPSIADAGIPDLGAIIAAQDSWNVFRCTPSIPSMRCPFTAKLNLERLELSLKNHEGWSNWSPPWDESDFQHGGQIVVEKLGEATRDKLLAITQTFLHKALSIHKLSARSSSSGESPASNASGSNFILLPPVRVLEFFLRSYVNSFERFYPTSAQGRVDVNDLMHNFNDSASSLLVLMMIAQGAMNIPSVEARWLTGGFTEACRISLFHLIEQNIIMSGDPIVLRAALLFTVQAAWSGDKWQMDIAMGQRGMYFSMLRHSGILETLPVVETQMNGNTTTDTLWTDWMIHESRSRLIYSWVMVDQDMSLFHDTSPLFSVTDLGAPMPDSDVLWHAHTANDWSESFNHVHAFSDRRSSVGSGVRPPSLRGLFRSFLDDEIVINDKQEIHLTSMQLRLLLHPLQTLVSQYCQLISCFSDSMSLRPSNRALTASSTRVRFDEVQVLLDRWHLLAKRYMTVNAMCPMMQTNLVMFHLISMNTVSNFPEIERFARREGIDGSYQSMLWMHKRCLADAQEAVVHCGQVLRHLRDMPRGIRPPWWPGAVYRAALVMWTDSFVHNDSSSPNQQAQYQQLAPFFPIDGLPMEHRNIQRYLSRKEGVPTMTKQDGSPVPLHDGFAVLNHCIDVIDEGVATRFSDGIRNKLEKLIRG